MKTTTDVTNLDPFTFEIIRHKMFRVIDEGLITLGKVSGTSTTAEGHDVLVALYLPDGTLLTCGLGFLEHLIPASRAVKQIMDSFADDPGIFEGDIYFANDPYTVAFHCPDVYIITPIHFEGKLASWVVNYVHVTDIGGVDVGGFCPNATEVYHEGFSTKGLKIVERGKLRKDIYETFLNMIRDPGMTGLDLKSQMTANYVVKDRMERAYAEYGVEAVEGVCRQLIDQSEERLRRRLRELPDGTWRARRYLDLPHKTYLFDLVATKEDDHLIYDFSGTEEQASFPVNCEYSHTKGAALAPVLPLLAWDMTWNEGITRCLEVIAPEGTLLNARRPAPISLNTISSAYAVKILSNAVIAKMLAASDRYQDRAVGCWMGTNVAAVVGGLNRFGEYAAQLGTDVFGMPEGARSFKDGAGSGGFVANVALKMANVEYEEQAFPKMFLYRRVVPDSGGPGRFRGGPSHEHALVPHGGGDDSMLAVVTPGSGELFPGASGISGGYPGATTAHRAFRQSNVAELPYSLDSTEGQRVEDMRAKAVPIAKDDILYLRQDGGGGYGDPLDRDPELVLQDVLVGDVKIDAARRVYGVVVDESKGLIEDAATRAERRALRASRLGRDPLVDDFRADVDRTKYRINEYLQVKEDGSVVQCTWCGAELCGAGEAWRSHAVMRTSPAVVAGPPRRESDEYVSREFFCPSCATCLEVQVTRVDEEPLHDTIIRWPS